MHLRILHVMKPITTAEIFLNQGEKVLTMKSYFTEDTLIHMNSELQIKVKTWLLEEK